MRGCLLGLGTGSRGWSVGLFKGLTPLDADFLLTTFHRHYVNSGGGGILVEILCFGLDRPANGNIMDGWGKAVNGGYHGLSRITADHTPILHVKLSPSIAYNDAFAD